MSGSYGPTLGRRMWMAFSTIITIGIATMAVGRTSDIKDDITGTVSQTEPPIKQDGTAAHPYSDASQCPGHTDLFFWPSGSSVHSFPPSISVCFAGNQPFENSGADRVEVRDAK
jgi:hypothetical protein